MSAMSASSGLMPLSLISEHKAAQGGPPPVQQLAFAPEKHPLVQAPKPTPNGMETSPPLVPVSPPPQPEPQPSLPCGGVSETTVTNDEDRSGGAVPEVQPVEPSPSSVPAVPEQLPAAEPAEPPVPEPPVSNSLPPPSEPVTLTQPPVEAPVPDVLKSAQTTPPAQVQQLPTATPLPEPVKPEAAEQPVSQAKPEGAPETEVQKIPEDLSVDAPPTPSRSEEAKDKTAKTCNDTPTDLSTTSLPEPETKTEQSPKSSDKETNKTAPAESAPAANPVAPPAPAATVAAPVTPSVGRPSKRAKNTNSGAEKKSATPSSAATPKPSTPAPSSAAATPATTDADNGEDKRTKRKRLPTQVYQSPIPEETLIAKISKIDKNAAPDDKLIVFYRNEFLAVRNTEGGFYVCQAMQNVYKSSSKIRIRWLSQVANTDHYSPDFYDTTEFDCILTNLNLERIEKNKYRLPDVESQRTQSILKRAIDVENGIAPPEEATVTEEHPDGLDLSLYRNEDQLKKRKKGNRNKPNKKKLKKAIEEAKKSRETVRRNKPVVEPKKTNPVVSQPPKRVGRAVTGKIEKPVVQRIVAAKKMGKRKGAVPTSPPTANKSSTQAAPAVNKEVAKKKEVAASSSGKGAALKRKSSEPQPAPVPEKKVKTGASKTRNL